MPPGGPCLSQGRDEDVVGGLLALLTLRFGGARCRVLTAERRRLLEVWDERQPLAMIGAPNSGQIPR